MTVVGLVFDPRERSVCGYVLQTLSCYPQTLNPKPETLNPKPETRNHNPKPETLNFSVSRSALGHVHIEAQDRTESDNIQLSRPRNRANAETQLCRPALHTPEPKQPKLFGFGTSLEASPSRHDSPLVLLSYARDVHDCMLPACWPQGTPSTGLAQRCLPGPCNQSGPAGRGKGQESNNMCSS